MLRTVHSHRKRRLYLIGSAVLGMERQVYRIPAMFVQATVPKDPISHIHGDANWAPFEACLY